MNGKPSPEPHPGGAPTKERDPAEKTIHIRTTGHRKGFYNKEAHRRRIPLNELMLTICDRALGYKPPPNPDAK